MFIENPFPTLETERLVLRPMELKDLDFVFRHFSDPQVTQYLYDNPPLKDKVEAQQIIDFYLNDSSGLQNRWVLERKSDGQPIGTCGFHRWEKRYFRTEIGYDLSPEFWRQGYMSEALQGACQYGFDKMRLNRIDALVYVGNQASLGILKKLGFQQEGVLRDYFYQNETFYDHALLSLLGKEWHSGVNK